ncbi:hypothetical protein IWX48DRAFT_627784 [Phyllosticta citricarpa]
MCRYHLLSRAAICLLFHGCWLWPSVCCCYCGGPLNLLLLLSACPLSICSGPAPCPSTSLPPPSANSICLQSLCNGLPSVYCLVLVFPPPQLSPSPPSARQCRSASGREAVCCKKPVPTKRRPNQGLITTTKETFRAFERKVRAQFVRVAVVDDAVSE